MKILVFLPEHLGDIVIGTPIYRAMREQFGPRGRIVALGRRHQFDLFGGTDWFDDFWPSSGGRNEDRLGAVQIVRQMRKERFDLGVLMDDAVSSGVLSMLGGIRRRVGYSRRGRDWCMTDILPLPKNPDGRVRPEPLIHRYLRIAGHLSSLPEGDSRLSCPVSLTTSSKSARSLRSFMKLELLTLPEDDIAAEEQLRRWGIRTDRRIVFLHSSGFFGTARRWPEAYLAVLAQMIVDRLNHDVVILRAPRDNDDESAKAVDFTHRDRVFFVHLRNYGIAKALLKRGRLMVSTDSGLAKVAQAVGLPLIGLYGPTTPLRNSNPTGREEVISIDIGCQGCQQRDCPKGHSTCMNDLFPERVFYQVENRLGERRRAA